MNKMEQSDTKKSIEHSAANQYLATAIVNLIILAHGAGVGWSAASMTVLQSDDNPLPLGKLDMETISWIASLLSLGGLFGNITFGFITNRFGRKIPLLFVGNLIIVRDQFNLNWNYHKKINNILFFFYFKNNR